jgi:hypothetical protein
MSRQRSFYIPVALNAQTQDARRQAGVCLTELFQVAVLLVPGAEALRPFVDVESVQAHTLPGDAVRRTLSLPAAGWRRVDALKCALARDLDDVLDRRLSRSEVVRALIRWMNAHVEEMRRGQS